MSPVMSGVGKVRPPILCTGKSLYMSYGTRYSTNTNTGTVPTSTYDTRTLSLHCARFPSSIVAVLQMSGHDGITESLSTTAAVLATREATRAHNARMKARASGSILPRNPAALPATQ